MISIARYLRENRDGPAGSATADSPVYAALCASILDYIGVYVFTGEFSHLRPKLEENRRALAADIREMKATQVDESVRGVLSGYNRIAQQALQTNAVEMQQMVSVLGHALTVISGGSERSASRLRGIQETLRDTSTIQDVAALRASLRDVVQLIGEESSQEQQTILREREGIETQVVRFRELLAGNPHRKLMGRDVCIRAISDSTGNGRVWVMAFFFDQLKGIVQRYGPEVVDDIFQQLIRGRLQPIAPESMAFRWSPSGIVGIAQIESDAAKLQVEMAKLNRAPLVCRIALGNRTAVLNVALSHLLLEVTGPLDQLIADIDRFTRYTSN